MTPALQGFDSLLNTCRRLDIPARTLPPATRLLVRSELPGSPPLDPSLLALYARVGGLVIGGSPGALQLCRRDDEINHLASLNAERVRRFAEPFKAVVLFAEEPATLYCFALVPELADAEGFQPVVLIDPYEEVYALPIASNLDRFFQTYARCLEFVAANSWASATGTSDVNFWSLPEIVAGDERLAEMLGAGAFEAMMRQDEESKSWVQRVMTSRPDRARD